MRRLAHKNNYPSAPAGTSARRGAATLSSVSTTPSRRRTTRRACAAMSSSCVTTTSVLPAARQALEEAHDVLGRRRVEVARRLVGQQDRGAVDERARDGHALPLPARELVGPVRHAVAQPDRAERLGRPRAALGPRDARVDERQLDVLEAVLARQQVERLEDEPDLPVADVRERVVRERRPRPARRAGTRPSSARRGSR